MPKSKTPADDIGPLTPVVFHTLLALADGPLHGYAISQEVEAATDGSVPMGPGTLYGSLQRMQNNGLVQEVSVPSTGGHADRRRYYSLTAAGRAALEREARRLSKAVDLARARSVLEEA